MPLVRPFRESILFVAVPFLGFAEKLFVIAFDLLQVVIGRLAIFLFEFPLKLHPFSLELLCIRNVFLLYLCILSACPP